MADLLRSGNTMLNKACPVCNNPIFRNKEGNTFCPTCNRNVLIVDSSSRQDDAVKKSEQYYNEQENKRHNRQINLLYSLQETLLEKIEILNKKLKNEIKETLKDAGSTTLTLLKILIPVSIIVKILSELGAIEIIGDYLSHAMGVVGLPGEFGLVWATAMLTNIYGAIVVLFSLSLESVYTVAQVTVLAGMILFAHALPIEARIAQKAGVKLWFTLSLRILGAIAFGFVLNLIFSNFNLFQNESSMIWQPDIADPTIFQWIFDQIKYYLIIFLIILGLVTLMRILQKSGAIKRLNNFLKPGLEFLGMNKNAAPITIIGTTLGITYGGGLIINEIRSGKIKAKDAFLSVSLMGLSHSLIEDTLLMMTLGASLIGILFGRVIFTLLFMFIFIRIISIISEKTFKKYFYNLPKK